MRPPRPLGQGLLLQELRVSAVGEQLGYRAQTVKRAAQWALSRIMLHTGVPNVSAASIDELVGLADAIDRFGAHPARERFHGDDASWASKLRNWGSQLFLLQLLLFHTGQLPELPREPIPLSARRAELPPKVAAMLNRYLTARRQLDRPGTIQNIEAGLRRFTNWLVDTRPEITSFLEVTREDCTAFAVWLDQQRHHRTGQPYAIPTSAPTSRPCSACSATVRPGNGPTCPPDL